MPEAKYKSEAKYKAETPADDLLKVLKRLSYCSEAKNYFKKFAGGSVLEMVEGTLDQSWASWYLAVLGEDNEIKLRKIMISRIKDPMMAFTLYLRLSYLTDEEDKLLELKFKGKLPTAEAELAKGIVKREKICL